MSTESEAQRHSDPLVAGAAVVMVVCCAVGPAVLGAAAGSLIGGWLGIACATLLAAVAGVYVLRRRQRREC